jgi:hypothetical protein
VAVAAVVLVVAAVVLLAHTLVALEVLVPHHLTQAHQ